MPWREQPNDLTTAEFRIRLARAHICVSDKPPRRQPSAGSSKLLLETGAPPLRHPNSRFAREDTAVSVLAKTVLPSITKCQAWNMCLSSSQESGMKAQHCREMEYMVI